MDYKAFKAGIPLFDTIEALKPEKFALQNAKNEQILKIIIEMKGGNIITLEQFAAKDSESVLNMFIDLINSKLIALKKQFLSI